MTDVNADGYQYISGKEGNAPFLMSKVTDKDGEPIDSGDIDSIAVTIKNLTTLATVLDAEDLPKADVWFDTYQNGTDQDGSTVSYNFGWQTLASYFSLLSVTHTCQFAIEVWVTPISGEPFDAGWWKYTAKKSILPVEAIEE